MKTEILNWVQKNAPSLEARDYQIDAWSALQKRRAQNRKRALVHLATGLGKTSVAAVDVSRYLKEEEPNGKVLFISHMNDISYQAQNTFKFVDPNMTTDIFRGKIKDVDVTFATFQSFIIGDKLKDIDPEEFSYIIYDEAHHIEADTFSLVRKHFKPKFELALTATPERADGRDIFNYFGHPIFTKSLAEGINDGWLSAIDYHIVFDDAIREAMDKKFEPKTLKEIRELFAIRSRNDVISKEVLQRRHEIGLDKAKTIVFCQNITAASEMAALLGGEVYHSEVATENRDDIMRRFKTGEMQVICTVDMFNEGIDIPDARLVVFLRSTSSRTIFEQQLGRGLRRAPGKDKVTVLDFVANVERINFVRELGRHVAPASGSYSGKSGGMAGVIPRERGQEIPFDRFTVNTFQFEDKVVELMERYDVIKSESLDYLKTEDVVNKYKELNSISKTARYYGVSWQAIKKHLKKANIVTEGFYASDRGITRDVIIEAYKELGSVNKVGEKLEISTWVVSRHLKAAGFVITRFEKKLASKELIEAYKKFGTVRKAAESLDMHHNVARKHLINAGIDTSRYYDRGGRKGMKRPGRDYIDPIELANSYKQHNGDITAIVMSVGRGSWANTYKALDRDGYIKKPITSAVAAAAYYKYGTSIKAGEVLGVSGSLISRKAKDAKYLTKYNNKVKSDERME